MTTITDLSTGSKRTATAPLAGPCTTGPDGPVSTTQPETRTPPGDTMTIEPEADQ